MKHYWQALKPGDTVEIVAPASGGFTDEEIQKSVALLTEFGLKARVPEPLKMNSEWLIANGFDPFCSHTDEFRAKHFYDACTYEDSQAIWCVRGGYGSTRILPALEKLSPPRKAKLFIGLSDITALHIFINQQWGWPTIHGKGISQFVRENEKHEPSLQEIKELIFGKKSLTYTDLIPLNSQAKNIQCLKSSVIGGNLCLLQHSIGTTWQVNTAQKFLFLEDVNVRGYSLDRALEHLYQAGILNNIQALILGDFIKGEEKDGQDLCHYAIKRFAEKLKIPVIALPGIGHGLISHPLPLGTQAELYLGDAPRLICDTGAL